jgi:hypothetical protein
MILALLVSLAAPAPPAFQADDPPVRIKLNHEEFLRSDRARVHVETARDGHLVVLHADPEGRVRVLFPLDPSDDDFLRGGERHEIRGRGDREAFFVDAEEGSGTVLAAFSPDPFNYEAFVRGDHWDYRVLRATAPSDDALAGLLDIVHRMAGETRFEYDAATYVVGGRHVASRYGHGYSGSSVHFGYGYPYGWGLGFSYGYPYRYRHFYYPYYRSFYDPFCYDYDSWGWGGWGGSCYRYGFGYRTIFYTRNYGYGRRHFGGTVFNRPRSVAPGFVLPRDRVRVTPVESRRRVSVDQPGVFRERVTTRVRTSAPVRVRESSGRVSVPRESAPRGRVVAPRTGSGGARAVRPSSGVSRSPAISRGGGSSVSRGGGSSVSRGGGSSVSRGGRPSVSRGGGGGGGRGSSPAARPSGSRRR